MNYPKAFIPLTLGLGRFAQEQIMARHFNGGYSVRAGYHGVRKNHSGISGWFFQNGHWNPSTELVDERASGGFVHQRAVTTCKQCAAEPARADVPPDVKEGTHV